MKEKSEKGEEEKAGQFRIFSLQQDCGASSSDSGVSLGCIMCLMDAVIAKKRETRALAFQMKSSVRTQTSVYPRWLCRCLALHNVVLPSMARYLPISSTLYAHWNSVRRQKRTWFQISFDSFQIGNTIPLFHCVMSLVTNHLIVYSQSFEKITKKTQSGNNNRWKDISRRDQQNYLLRSHASLRCRLEVGIWL